MPKIQTREYRALTPLAIPLTAAEKRINSDYYVQGYAANYETYPLYDMGDGTVIYERFEPGCFTAADMSDIIMQYDHSGRVFARKSNGTLVVQPDENGLFIAADLSKTDGAKDLYGDISAGMITKMSWCFAFGDYEFDEKSSTIIHHTVRKIYDVSAVSIPANDSTEIYARSADNSRDGLIAQIAAEYGTKRLDERRKRIYIQTLTII